MKGQLLADTAFEELGLGDLVNRFASVKKGTTLFIQDFSRCRKVTAPENVIRDIIKNKNVAIKKVHSSKNYQSNILIKRNELDRKNSTELVFSPEELEWAIEVLKDCGLSRKEKILAICNNIPGGRGSEKMWLEQHWISLVSNVLRNDPEFRVVLLPNFRKPGDQSDGTIMKLLSQDFPSANIYSLQDYFLDNLATISVVQKLFGQTRNTAGLSLRQFGALASVLFGNERSFAVFNDTGLAHLTVAALGRNCSSRIVSVNVENILCYGLRNGGKSFSFEVDSKKTEPEKVGRYILKIKDKTE